MVLHVFKSKIYSGAENVARQIMQGLSDREDFVYMSPHGPIEDKLKTLGLYTNYYGVKKLDASSIREAAEKFRPDVVHAHDFTAGVLCAFALRGSVPIISHLHNNPPWIKAINYKTISYLMASKYFAQILTVSNSVKNEYRFTKYIKCPMDVIGNPFSAKGVTGQVDTAADLPEYDLLFVGRLTEQKNPKMFLEVTKVLASKGLVKKAAIVGDGELYGELDNYAKNNGLGSIVSMEGFKKNSYDYMSHSKIIMMPSKWEGFGLVALEAMALGRPVIASSGGALKDIVTLECGYSCETLNDYVKAATELLTNNDVYEAKSSGAYKRAMEFDNSSSYCDRLYGIYTSLKQKGTV